MKAINILIFELLARVRILFSSVTSVTNEPQKQATLGSQRFPIIPMHLDCIFSRITAMCCK